MDPQDVVRKKGLKATHIRIAIVTILMNAPMPLSESEIKELMIDTYDRVTFYRSMKAMLDAGIIHSIASDEQKTVYALNTGHQHAHFVCDLCHRTICLDESPEVDVRLPKGFSTYHTDIVLHGVCDSCSLSK